MRHDLLPNTIQIVLFWFVQVSALLAFVVPFKWSYVGIWAVSHFLRAIGLTLAFHRYFAHRAFRTGRLTALRLDGSARRFLTAESRA